MGFSLTGAHIVFFVGAVIVAGTVSGVFIGVTLNITSSLEEKGKSISEQLDTDFIVINDPKIIPLSGGYYLFYLKNIGNNKLTTTNETFQIFIDGEIIPINSYYFSNNSIVPTHYTTMSISQNFFNPGYHRLRLVGPHSINEVFIFEI